MAYDAQREAQLAIQRFQTNPGELKWTTDLPEAAYQQIVSSLQGMGRTDIVSAMQPLREQYYSTSKGQQEQQAALNQQLSQQMGQLTQQMISTQIEQQPQISAVQKQLLSGEMGLTPQAQQQANQQYELIQAELRRRAIAEQQGLESNLSQRGMLRSSLYGQGSSGISQGLLQSLGQARIGTQQQALQNQMAQIGMGLGQSQWGAGFGQGQQQFGAQLNFNQQQADWERKQAQKNSGLESMAQLAGIYGTFKR